MRLLIASSPLLLLACSSGGSTFDGGTDPTDGATLTDGGQADTAIQPSDAAAPDAGGPAVIYAHTDDELYVMDPMTLMLKHIGPFDDGSGGAPLITDLAVNQAGEVWVNSIDSIFKATVPKVPGKVMISKVVSIKVTVNQRFYAMGITPPNVLGATEMLVAGDSLGDLYAVDMQGNTTKLGAFGSDGTGGVYGLSGDVMFYLQNGKTRGLATVRPYKNGTATTTNNDILAEIDIAAMTTAWNTKTPQPLRKQFLGAGTTFGRLYGIGAWNDSVYAFQRLAQGSPAQLVQINGSGVGKSIQTFSNITVGWSGAGVTTTAPITVLPPN